MRSPQRNVDFRSMLGTVATQLGENRIFPPCDHGPLVAPVAARGAKERYVSGSGFVTESSAALSSMRSASAWTADATQVRRRFRSWDGSFVVNASTSRRTMATAELAKSSASMAGKVTDLPSAAPNPTLSETSRGPSPGPRRTPMRESPSWMRRKIARPLCQASRASSARGISRSATRNGKHPEIVAVRPRATTAKSPWTSSACRSARSTAVPCATVGLGRAARRKGAETLNAKLPRGAGVSTVGERSAFGRGAAGHAASSDARHAASGAPFAPLLECASASAATRPSRRAARVTRRSCTATRGAGPERKTVMRTSSASRSSPSSHTSCSA